MIDYIDKLYCLSQHLEWFTIHNNNFEVLDYYDERYNPKCEAKDGQTQNWRIDLCKMNTLHIIYENTLLEVIDKALKKIGTICDLKYPTEGVGIINSKQIRSGILKAIGKLMKGDTFCIYYQPHKRENQNLLEWIQSNTGIERDNKGLSNILKGGTLWFIAFDNPHDYWYERYGRTLKGLGVRTFNDLNTWSH